MNPYQILGISEQATEQEIKSAYRHLVKQYHPDKNKSDDAARMIVLINEAYEILSDPQRRAQYDRPWREVFTQQAYQEDPREVYRREYIRKRQEREFEERRSEEEFDNFLISKISPFYKICRAVSYLLVFFVSLILVDSYLPVRIYDEPGIDGWYKKSTMRSYMRTKSLVVEVPNQVHFNYPYYSANRPILHIETTGLFKRVKNVSATSNKLILTFEF